MVRTEEQGDLRRGSRAFGNETHGMAERSGGNLDDRLLRSRSVVGWLLGLPSNISRGVGGNEWGWKGWGKR